MAVARSADQDNRDRFMQRRQCDGTCGWTGWVQIFVYLWVFEWTCPRCRNLHQELRPRVGAPVVTGELADELVA